MVISPEAQAAAKILKVSPERAEGMIKRGEVRVEYGGVQGFKGIGSVTYRGKRYETSDLQLARGSQKTKVETEYDVKTKTPIQLMAKYGISEEEAYALKRDVAPEPVEVETKPEKPKAALMPISFWERPGVRTIKAGVISMGEAAGSIISLGGVLDYEPRPETKVVGETSLTGEGGTLTFRQPTLVEMTPEQRFKQVIAGAQIETYVESSKIVGELQTKYQEKVDVGDIGVQEAKQLMKGEFKTAIQPIETKYKTRTEVASKQLGSEVLIAQAPLSFGKGLVFGGISTLAPPVGLALVGLGVGETSFKFAEVKQMFTTYPKEALLNVGAMFGGAVTGGFVVSKITPKVTGYFRTIGRKPIEPTQIIEPKVLVGTKTFPTARPSQHLKIFKTSPYKLPGEIQLGVWHATPQTFGKQAVVKAGTSELPGLYTAPSLSAYFLKLSPSKYKLFGWNMTSPLAKSPTALRITPRGLKVGKGLQMRGYAYVPGIKSEVEAILPPGTILQRTGAAYYVKWKGVRVPIQQYDVGGIGVGKSITAGKLTSSYSQIRPTPLITPTTVLGTSYTLSSRKISSSFYLGISSPKISYKPSSKFYGVSKFKSYVSKPSKTFLSSFKPSLSYLTSGISKIDYGGYNYLLPPMKKSYFISPLGKKGKKYKESFERGFFFQPSIAALGLRGTKYGATWKAPKVYKEAPTGLFTRFDVPTYRIKPKKRRKK